MPKDLGTTLHDLNATNANKIMLNYSVLKNLSCENLDVEKWIRVYLSKYPDPLGTGTNASRFCDPTSNFSVLYLAKNLTTSFVEVIVRDKHDGLSNLNIPEVLFKKMRIAEISSHIPLTVLNLTGDRMIYHGLPSDIVGSTDQDSGQIFSTNLYLTRPDVDGIMYPSRLVHDAVCLAVYDRAKFKLGAHIVKRWMKIAVFRYNA